MASEDSISGPKKRIEKRRIITEQVILRAVAGADEKNKGLPLRCVTVNVSDCGVGLYTDRPLDFNASFLIYSERLWPLPRRGTVRWCRRLAPGLYRAGMETDGGQSQLLRAAEDHEGFNR